MRHCRLCNGDLEPDDHVPCECGWHLHRHGARDHRSWCPAHGGTDRWIGAVEL